MVESVECAECGNRYDSQEDPFCPRCGSNTQAIGAAPVMAAARLFDPRRRRARSAGIVLIVLSLFFAAQFSFAAIVPADDSGLLGVAKSLPPGPGGELIVHVTSGNSSVVGAQVQFLDSNGTLQASLVTNSEGKASHQFTASLGNVTIAYEGQLWHRGVYIPAGSTTLSVDIATAPAGVTEAFAPSLQSVFRTAAIVGAVIAFFILGAGFAAFRLRYFAIAASGAFLPAAFGLAAVFLIPGAPFLWLMEAVLVYGFISILRARTLFS